MIARTGVSPDLWNRAVAGHHLLGERWPLVLQLNARQLGHIDEKGHGETLRAAVHRFLDRRLEQWREIVAGNPIGITPEEVAIGQGMMVSQSSAGDITFTCSKDGLRLNGNHLLLPVGLPAAVTERIVGKALSTIVDGIDDIAGNGRTIKRHTSNQDGLTVIELHPELLRDVSYRDLYGEPIKFDLEEKRAA